MTDPPLSLSSWSVLSFLSLAAVLFIALGVLLGMTYCEYRHDREVPQLSLTVAEQCMGLLKEVVPVTLVLARSQPRAVVLSPQTRDSLREARWVKP